MRKKQLKLESGAELWEAFLYTLQTGALFQDLEKLFEILSPRSQW